ncbi:MAG: primosomal protein N' [Bdellovibrionales bacterium]|nr:primosomal protein N' [Bdellovibrionales bacterium]
METFVEVAFPIPVQKTFTYQLPKHYETVDVGQRVVASLQKKKLTGFVVARSTEKNHKFTPSLISQVMDEEPLIRKECLELARYICEYHQVSLGLALALMVPQPFLQKSRKFLSLCDPFASSKDPKIQFIFDLIRKSKGMSPEYFGKKYPDYKKTLSLLKRKKIISLVEKNFLPKELPSSETSSKTQNLEKALSLLPEQEKALLKIREAILDKNSNEFLLKGVTGSGKTEVYLQASASCLEMGRKVLALVPEISLTPQFIERFSKRFGKRLAVFHSQLTPKKRAMEWNRVFEGQVDIVIGARSACFAPLENIGLILMDEEHDSSYKQEEGILYHARDIVKLRGQYHHAPIVYGSATPSIESYYYAQHGQYQLLTLSQRAISKEKLIVETIDLRQDTDYLKGQRLLSETLVEKIQETLKKNQQAVLFLNRRGFCSTVFCRSCEQTMTCKFCSITLTYHKKKNILQCHYCGYRKAFVQECSSCHSQTLIPIGYGTEKLEKELSYHFPDARIARMDRDQMQKRGAYEKVYQSLQSGEIDILLGTQMVTKGLDLPSVTCVGVLDADHSLHFPDFRSAEYTFNLLTQVIGRAGRGDFQGRAMIQTLSPHHYAIEMAMRQDYESFYKREVESRRELQYPPFSFLVLFEIAAKEEKLSQEMAQWLGKQIETHREGVSSSGLTLMGPSPAPVAMVNQWYRQHLLLRAQDFSLLHRFASWVFGETKAEFEKRKMKYKMDLNPKRFM